MTRWTRRYSKATIRVNAAGTTGGNSRLLYKKNTILFTKLCVLEQSNKNQLIVAENLLALIALLNLGKTVDV